MTDEQAKTQAVTAKVKNETSPEPTKQFTTIAKMSQIDLRFKIFALKVGCGMTQREIAAELKISPSAVQQHLNKIPEDILTEAIDHTKKTLAMSVHRANEKLLEHIESPDREVSLRAIGVLHRIIGSIAAANVQIDKSTHTTYNIHTQAEVTNRLKDAFGAIKL